MSVFGLRCVDGVGGEWVGAWTRVCKGAGGVVLGMCEL